MNWKTKRRFSEGKVFEDGAEEDNPVLTAIRQIKDDNYHHALRVYRDIPSGAVRLQASVHKGEMKRYVGSTTALWLECRD